MSNAAVSYSLMSATGASVVSLRPTNRSGVLQSEGYERASVSNLNRSATGTFKRLAILSRVSNEGALIPRSTKLRKSTDRLSVSANRS